MNVTIPRKLFQEALGPVCRAAAGKSTLPILSNILIQADGERLRLAATDLEFAVERFLPAEVATPGEVTVPARALAELVGGLTGDSLTLKSDAQHQTVVKCGRSEYRLLGLAPEEFPALPEVASEIAFTVAQADLKAALRWVLPAVSPDDTRPVLTGVCVQIAGGEAKLVATDTHRLAVRTLPLAEATGEGTRLLPGRALEEVLRLLAAESAEPARFTSDANQARFQIGDGACITSRLIEGAFPRWERVLPTAYTRRVQFSTDGLLMAVKRAAIVAREDSNRLTLATQAGGTLTLTAQSGALGKAYEEVEADVEGEETAIVLNARYLQDALNVLDGGAFGLEMTEPLAPVLFRPEEGSGLLVVMPMQVN